MPSLSDTLRALVAPRQDKRRAPRRGTTGKGVAQPRSATAAPTRASSPDRDALIAEALRIRRAKQRLLEALPPEEQFLLKVMANEMTGSSTPPQNQERPPRETRQGPAPGSKRP
jgi:hypothetical protein